MSIKNNPCDPSVTEPEDVAPWSKSCSPWDPRCSTEFYLAVKPDNTCEVFKHYYNALAYIDDSNGTIHKVHPINRVYPQACNSYNT